MGWKGTLRSMNAASNRAARESEKRENATRRVHAKINKNEQGVIDKARTLEERAHRDPIKAFHLRYIPSQGFSSQPFEVNTDFINGSITILADNSRDDATFRPSRAKTKQGAVTPLDMLVTQWGTIVAISVENFDDSFRLRTPWFKKSDPPGSAVFLLDTESNDRANA